MTQTETATRTADLNAKLAAWASQPKSQQRTRAMRSLRLSLKALRGEKIPAWVSATIEF
jgi:hypothetical protein